RKLIILDLNGTLLYRAPPESRDLYPRKRGRYPLYITTRPLRIVYARLYIPSFRKYLFHAETRKWLDVMVWNSAQPHSNVDAGTQEEKEGEKKNSGLIAVWAKDTLGLNKAAYNSKSQTTKNLDKPWEQLTPLIPGNENFSPEEMQRAREMLQPWNHFCVPEYSREVWLRDGRVVA
ncbi:hypothetical protein K435DRAFT_569034, partial [Dendrothele bispora CBS 962.96]